MAARKHNLLGNYILSRWKMKKVFEVRSRNIKCKRTGYEGTFFASLELNDITLYTGNCTYQYIYGVYSVSSTS